MVRQNVLLDKFIVLFFLSSVSFTKTSLASKQMFGFLLIDFSVRLTSLALASKRLLISFLLKLLQLLGLLRVPHT